MTFDEKDILTPDFMKWLRKYAASLVNVVTETPPNLLDDTKFMTEKMISGLLSIDDIKSAVQVLNSIGMRMQAKFDKKIEEMKETDEELRKTTSLSFNEEKKVYDIIKHEVGLFEAHEDWGLKDKLRHLKVMDTTLNKPSFKPISACDLILFNSDFSIMCVAFIDKAEKLGRKFLEQKAKEIFETPRSQTDLVPLGG